MQQVRGGGEHVGDGVAQIDVAVAVEIDAVSDVGGRQKLRLADFAGEGADQVAQRQIVALHDLQRRQQFALKQFAAAAVLCTKALKTPPQRAASAGVVARRVPNKMAEKNLRMRIPWCRRSRSCHEKTARSRWSIVMAGLVPAIHVFGSTAKEDVDARDKPGHDGGENAACGRLQLYCRLAPAPTPRRRSGGPSAQSPFDRRPPHSRPGWRRNWARRAGSRRRRASRGREGSSRSSSARWLNSPDCRCHRPKWPWA